MKLSVWIYLGVFILVTPLFIYDMYAQKKINFTFIIAIIALIYFFTPFFKKKIRIKKEQRKKSSNINCQVILGTES